MENQPIVKEECPVCHGSGVFHQAICSQCDGKGTILTETGQKIVDYLRNCIRMSEN